MVAEELAGGVLDSGMYSLHCASRRALASGQLKKAARLACGSILLRSFFSKKGLDANGHRIVTDETDFAILLNFFADRMLKIRAFLHKQNRDRFFQKLYVNKVLPHVAIYRALVRQVFPAIKCETKFSGLAAALVTEPSVSASGCDQYYAMQEFYLDECYGPIVQSCKAVASNQASFTEAEFASCILRVGEMLVRVTDQAIEATGGAPIYAEAILWRLLVVHDAHFAGIFGNHKDQMLLLPHAA